MFSLEDISDKEETVCTKPFVLIIFGFVLWATPFAVIELTVTVLEVRLTVFSRIKSEPFSYLFSALVVIENGVESSVPVIVTCQPSAVRLQSDPEHPSTTYSGPSPVTRAKDTDNFSPGEVILELVLIEAFSAAGLTVNLALIDPPPPQVPDRPAMQWHSKFLTNCCDILVS